MKLQHLAIIFIIIMLPISLVMSEYMSKQIDTISLQTKYNSKLQTAAYDALKAFQLNTLNNKYSTNSDSKIRDIEASVKTFYNSLGTEFGASGYTSEDLQPFIPAMVYTMYDGFYIYGKYYNENKSEYQYGLRPYIYYSCRYVNGSDDFVVNYTLDNNITVYGTVGRSYVTKSGTLVYADNYDTKIASASMVDGYCKSISYDGETIESEILEEYLCVLNDNNISETGNNTPYAYQYTVFNGQKIYYDKDHRPASFDATKYLPYFRYYNNKKEYITIPTEYSTVNNEVKNFLEKFTIGGNLYCNSGPQYYYDAYQFSKWVKNNLGSIKQSDAVDVNIPGVDKTIRDFAIETNDSEKIFVLNNTTNNPLLESSIFNQNRVSVIRRTIQSTLNTAINTYSSSANYDFRMPVFQEEDWDKLENNIAMAVFMQGFPIGAKYYNNYYIITNNKNKEVVTKDSIYIITNDNVAHKAASKHVIDSSMEVKTAYSVISFEAQTVSGDVTYTYHPHAYERCYTCIVGGSEEYRIDDVISGNMTKYDPSQDKYVSDSILSNRIKDTATKLRKKYLTALGREKFNLYKTNGYFGT